MAEKPGERKSAKHIVLTSHPATGGPPLVPIRWGTGDPRERGPLIGSLTDRRRRNVIGAHSGSYAIYRALAIASGSLDRLHRPDLTNTAPPLEIGPYPQWSEPGKIVSIDPFGHRVSMDFADLLRDSWDIRPTIAVTRARLTVPELRDPAVQERLKPDGRILLETGEANVTKAAIEPVWYLPGIAERCGVDEQELRRILFEQTGGMFPELVTRPDLKVFLPPIGSISVYCFGNMADLANSAVTLACRVHDECNGSDVFGSDICTCRPYLVQGIEVCIATAQTGGVGLIVYNRKEGRGLGEVTKFLVYNARKRGGDSAASYFLRTECVAGVQDVRFQDLMPDVLHWLGVRRIHRLVSMSNLKFDAIVRQGIEVGDRVEMTEDRIPADAQVELAAKRAAGYFTSHAPKADDLQGTKGRDLGDY